MKKALRKFLNVSFLPKLLEKLYFMQKLIDIDKIRCQRGKEYSNFCGFGGKSIKNFPPYEIFEEYLKNPENARTLFTHFFYDNLLKKNAFDVPKERGGWYNGSLYRETYKLFKANNIIFNKNTILKNKNLVDQAIEHRINHYITVFKSIRKNGFDPLMNPLIVEKYKGLYYLINGHHRIAMLSALGYKKVYLLKKNIFKNSFEKIYYYFH